jgi:hypothetical protein
VAGATVAGRMGDVRFPLRGAGSRPLASARRDDQARGPRLHELLRHLEGASHCWTVPCLRPRRPAAGAGVTAAGQPAIPARPLSAVLGPGSLLARAAAPWLGVPCLGRAYHRGHRRVAGPAGADRRPRLLAELVGADRGRLRSPPGEPDPGPVGRLRAARHRPRSLVPQSRPGPARGGSPQLDPDQAPGRLPCPCAAPSQALRESPGWVRCSSGGHAAGFPRCVRRGRGNRLAEASDGGQRNFLPALAIAPLAAGCGRPGRVGAIPGAGGPCGGPAGRDRGSPARPQAELRGGDSGKPPCRSSRERSRPRPAGDTGAAPARRGQGQEPGRRRLLRGGGGDLVRPRRLVGRARPHLAGAPTGRQVTPGRYRSAAAQRSGS